MTKQRLDHPYNQPAFMAQQINGKRVMLPYGRRAEFAGAVLAETLPPNYPLFVAHAVANPHTLVRCTNNQRHGVEYFYAISRYRIAQVYKCYPSHGDPYWTILVYQGAGKYYFFAKEFDNLTDAKIFLDKQKEL